MLRVWAFSLAFQLSLVGLGAATGLLLERVHSGWRLHGLADRGLLGLDVATGIALAVHGVAPLGPGVAGALQLAGAAGLVACLWREGLRGHARELAVLAVATAVLAAIAIHPPLHPDTGLYHLQSILWLSDRAWSTGLANLHGRLGFNSLLYVLAALHRGPGPGTGMLLFANVSIAGLVLAGLLRRVARPEAGAAGSAAWWGAAAGVVAVLAGRWHFMGLGSPDADVAVALSTVYLLVLLLGRPGVGAPDWALAGALTAWIVGAKLSAAVPMLGAGLLLAAGLREAGARERRAAAILVAGLGVFGGLWLARSLSLSGCLLYPFEASCLDVAWRVPAEQVRDEALWIRSWARDPGGHAPEVLADWRWLSGWLARSLRWGPFRWFAVATPIAAVAAGLAAWRLRSGPSRGAAARDFGGALRVAALVPLPGLAAWFASAPDPRFALGLLIGLPLVLGAAALAVAPAPPRHWAPGLAALLVAGLLAKGTYPLSVSLRYGMLLEGRERVPRAALQSHDTAGGLRVAVPAEGHQCWAAPRPCAAVPRPLLAGSDDGHRIHLRQLGPGEPPDGVGPPPDPRLARGRSSGPDGS